MIKINVPESDLPECFWENMEFKDVLEIFPQWIFARAILENYVEELGDFVVTQQGSSIDIGPNQPTTYDGRFLLCQVFPIEDRPLFFEIFTDCVRKYTPSLGHFLGQKLSPNILYEIESEIKKHSRIIENMGGPTFKEFLGFKLGLCPMGLNLNINFDGDKDE